MISRTQARKVTLGAQVASLVLASGAVGVAAMGLPLGEAAPFTPIQVANPEEAAPAEGESASTGVPDFSQVDFTGIVERFARVRNAPKVETQPTVTTPGGEDPKGGGGIGESAGDEVRYLGMIQIGARRSAMLVIGGKQRIVGQGAQETGGEGAEVRVLSVHPEFVVAEVNGERTRITKSERQASAVTTIERTPESIRRANENQNRAALAAQGRTGESPDEAQNPRADFERRRREAIDRALEEGRITQEEAQRMLDRMNSAVNNRRGRDD
ncbi:MAG: hypothetical protein ACIARR_13620 [Phycisphaerales bacterium JB059]